METKNKPLDDFSWDNWETPSEDVVTKETTTVVEEKVEEKEEEPTTKVEKEKQEKVEEKEDISFEEDEFESFEEKTVEVASTLLSKFKEEGIFSNLKEEDWKDKSDDDIVDLLDLELEARIDETFQAFFEDMDEDGIAFLKFKKEGGSTEDFIRAYSSSKDIPKGTIDDVNYQKQIVSLQMKEDGKDSEEIKDQLTWLEENGKLKGYAQKYEAKLLEKDKVAKEQLVIQQQKEAQLAKEKRELLSKTLMKTLDDNESIGSLIINKNDKKQLHQYITTPKVKVGKDSYITEMQRDLSEVFKNPEQIILLGKLLKSKFDFSDIERSLETKVTKKTKEKIDGKSTTIKSSSSSSERPKKALSDYF